MSLYPEEVMDYTGSVHMFADAVAGRLVRDTPYPYAKYPDAQCEALREAIAYHEGLDPDHILAGNGRVELIWLALQALAPRRVLFIGPVFSEYVRACEAMDIAYDIATPPAEQDFICGPAELRRIWDSNADLAVLCTPNNPAGTAYPNIQEMFGLLRVPRVLVDCTYREYLWGTPDYGHNSWTAYSAMIQQGVAVFTLSSFSSFFACPGLPLGYLTGDPAQLRRMMRARPPLPVSAFAQRMGVVLLEQLDAFQSCLAPLRHTQVEAALRLRRMACFDPDRVFEGPCFITAGLMHGLSAAMVRNRLLRQGLAVRNCDTIPGMPPGYIRVLIRPAKDMEPLLHALDWYAERGW